jgi:hypothetical protein
MITELEKQILGVKISSPNEWIDNIETCGLFVGKEEEVIRSNIKDYLLNLKKDWEAVLTERNIVIPTDDYEFAELVFAQSDYKSQSQKEDDLLPSAEELLQEAKNEKIKELESLYSNAQFIRVKNGHTFMIPLKGEFFNVVVANQVLAAKVNGSASLRAPDIDKNIRTLMDIPYSEREKFFKPAKLISFANFNLKEDKILNINACLTSSDLNDTDLNIFPEIEQVLIDI